MGSVENEIEKNIGQQDQPEIKHPSSKNNTSKTVGFWSIAIPSYCYFFGYSSFKYELEGLGFDSPEIPTTPGDVYFNAFNTFAFMGGKILPASKDLLIKHFDESWLLVLCLSIGAAIVTYLGQFIFYRFRANETPDAKTKSKTRRKPKSHISSTRHKIISVKNWTWEILSGSGQSHSLWISKSIYLAAFVTTGFFVMLPLILAAIAFISLVLMPPPIIGLKIAEEQLAQYSCPDSAANLINHPECSLITLKDGKSHIGMVYSKDSKFMYLLTKDEAKTIPLDQILQSHRKVMTGGIKRTNTGTGAVAIESLYCHREVSPFGSAQLLKPN